MINHEHLINLYLDGELDGPQFQALQGWVRDDREHARLFMRRVWLHRQVYDRMLVRDLQQLAEAADPGRTTYAIEELELLARGSELSAVVDITDEMLRRQRDAAERARQSSSAGVGVAQPPLTYRPLIIPRWLVYGMAAVLMLGVFVAVTQLFKPGRPSGWAERTPGPAPDNQPIAPRVATVTWIDDQPLLAGGRALAVGYEVRQGDRVELASGRIELTFETGARARFQGPANFTLAQANLAHLDRGIMTASVPPRAIGFTVMTPTMRVVDLGTEFGLVVDDQFASEVHVFLGEVAAAPAGDDNPVGSTVSLLANESATIDAENRQLHRIRSTNAKPFLSLAPHVGLLHRELVVNGDFEQGPAAVVTGQSLGDVQNLKVPGWEDAGRATVLGYIAAAEHRYPDPFVDAVPFDRGDRYFAGMENGTVSQRIDLRELAEFIDSTQLTATFSADLGGFSNNSEYLIARAQFLDESGRPIGSAVELQPVRSADRGGRSGFIARSQTFSPPQGSRSVQIELETLGNSDSNYVADGYADNVSLILRSRKD